MLWFLLSLYCAPCDSKVLCIMSDPCCRVIKHQPTNIMVEIRPVAPRSQSVGFVVLAQTVAALIKHVTPTVHRPKSKEPCTPLHL